MLFELICTYKQYNSQKVLMIAKKQTNNLHYQGSA